MPKRPLDLRHARDTFPRLDPDVLMRYRPIVEHLAEAVSILEVGRGDVGLGNLLGIHVVTCDIARPNAIARRESFVIASGTSLPFRSNSFDAVVAADVLEHIPRDNRTAVVRELARVARHIAILAFPCSGSSRAEARLQALMRGLRGVSNPWLAEHASLGLPTEEEVGTSVPSGWSIERLPNVNLAVWTANRVLADIFGVVAWPLPFLGVVVDFGRTYRTIFVLKRSD